MSQGPWPWNGDIETYTIYVIHVEATPTQKRRCIFTKGTERWNRMFWNLGFHYMCTWVAVLVGRATSHMSQGPWPWNGEGPCLSSKGRTMGIGKVILCSDGLSNILWRGMDHVEGPSHILLVGTEGQPYLTSYISLFSLFFNFSLWVLHWWGRKGEHVGSSWEKRKDSNCIGFVLVFAHDCATCAWYVSIGTQWRMGKCPDFEHLLWEYEDEWLPCVDIGGKYRVHQ